MDPQVVTHPQLNAEDLNNPCRNRCDHGKIHLYYINSALARLGNQSTFRTGVQQYSKAIRSSAF